MYATRRRVFAGLPLFFVLVLVLVLDAPRPLTEADYEYENEYELKAIPLEPVTRVSRV